MFGFVLPGQLTADRQRRRVAIMQITDDLIAGYHFCFHHVAAGMKPLIWSRIAADCVVQFTRMDYCAFAHRAWSQVGPVARE
jgi:hypothetical protein